MTLTQLLLLVVSLIAIGGMLVRPFRSPEWVWTLGGALALVLSGLLPAAAAASAVARGLDVYAFLIGIIALAELARYERLFEWLATYLLRAGGGSRARLFMLLYGVGTLVTALLSNDTTAVVLTPAVYAALARTDARPLPYLYACAFVANAASFVLPISNPANLVIFGRSLPQLVPWVAAFGGAAVAAIVLTYLALRLARGRDLAGTYRYDDAAVVLSARNVRAGIAIAAATLGLVAAAAVGIDVGYAALVLAVLALGVAAVGDAEALRFTARHVSWQIVPLVAGLFAIVAALDRAGALPAARALLTHAEQLGPIAGRLAIGAAVTGASNLFNNLPVALASGFALQSAPVAPQVAHATLVAVDLGPNLSVTGSLATVLWLIALRRDGVEVTAWQFLRLGIVVVTPALIAALLLVR